MLVLWACNRQHDARGFQVFSCAVARLSSSKGTFSSNVVGVQEAYSDLAKHG